MNNGNQPKTETKNKISVEKNEIKIKNERNEERKKNNTNDE